MNSCRAFSILLISSALFLPSRARAIGDAKFVKLTQATKAHLGPQPTPKQMRDLHLRVGYSHDTTRIHEVRLPVALYVSGINSKFIPDGYYWGARVTYEYYANTGRYYEWIPKQEMYLFRDGEWVNDALLCFRRAFGTAVIPLSIVSAGLSVA